MTIDWDNPENLEAVNLDTGDTAAVTEVSEIDWEGERTVKWSASWHSGISFFYENGEEFYATDPKQVAIRNKWGPPIPVDGKRPEWLGDDDLCNPRWEEEWFGSLVKAKHVTGWEIVTAIRLKSDHSYYQREAVKPAYMHLGKDAEKPDPADLELRCRALGYANGDLDKAKDIYRFLKGEG